MLRQLGNHLPASNRCALGSGFDGVYRCEGCPVAERWLLVRVVPTQVVSFHAKVGYRI